MIHGREQELERLTRLLEGLRAGRSFAVAVEGPAGIGKTTLLRALIERAGDARVLRAHGYESESQLPYAGLAELVWPVLELRDRLPEGQRRALESALALAPAAAADASAVSAGLLSLLAAAAEHGPLLVAVDDVHWLDEASRDAILLAAQRVEAEGVGIVLAARDRDGRPPAARSLERVPLAALDRDSAAQVLREAGPLPPEVVTTLLEVADGNPLALRALAGALTEDQRAGRSPLTIPRASGEHVEAEFARRVHAQPDATRRALCLLAAASGAHAALERAMAALGLDAGALEPALAAGLLSRDGERIAFQHPLLASVAYHDQPSGVRRAAHAALARATDGSRRAWHLAGAAIGPDAEAAAALEAAAGDARDRGAHAEAARALLRAAELSEDDDARARHELAAARELAATGDIPRAMEAAETAVRRSTDPLVRSGAAHMQAHVLMRAGRPARARAMLERLAGAAEDAGQRAAAAGLRLETSIAYMMEGDMEAMERLAERAHAQAGAEAPELAGLASLVRGEALLAMGRAAEGDALVAAAEPMLFDADPFSDLVEVVGMAANVSLWSERFERAERIVDGLVARARAAGSPARVSYPLSVRSQLNWRRGRWAAAYADADEAVQLARDMGLGGPLAVALPYLVRCEAGLGRFDAGRALGEEAVALGEAAAGDATVLHGVAALGFLELAAGRPEEALRWLLRADEILTRLRLRQPALTQYAGDLIEALLRVGRRAEAQAALERLAADAELTGAVWAHAVTERGRALLASDGAFEAHARAALARHDEVDLPFERARTELVLGERLRRARRRADARGPLERALAAFERLGAVPWAERARAELRAIGRRARGDDHPRAAVEQLTAHELQVALLVAEGMTNRDVAAALFLSPKTIDHHLGAIFRKLDLRSRAQLAVKLSQEGALSSS